MNLMKYFNYRYMIQNLKKSKAVLIFLLVLFPVLSILSTFVFDNVNYFTLRYISLFHIIGIYIIPIVLSACLFGFIHKQKSTDFTLSAPLSRKTIFTTNTVSGILFLILLVFLSAMGTYISSLFTPYIIPVQMILDYIFIWSITYIFVFVIANIAMSVTGNKITQIIVTFIILLLIPLFFNILFPETSSGTTLCYTTGNSDICYYISNNSDTNFTLPYNILITGNIYSLISFVKMIVISIIGFFIGLKLFLRRKMEVNETSFEKLRTHNFVKALTMFPIIMLISSFIVNDIISTLGAIISLVVLIAYFVIYDFITKHSISNIKVNILHFVVILVVMFPLCITLCRYYDDNVTDDKYIGISADDIESYKVSLDYKNFSLFDYYEVTDKDSIKLITDIITEEDDNYTNDGIGIQFKVKVYGDEYLIDNYLTLENFNKIEKEVLKNGKKKTELLKDNYVYALAINLRNFKMINFTSSKEILDVSKEVIKKDLPLKDYKLCKDLDLYAYKDGKVYPFQINSCKSDVLSDYVEDTLMQENNKAYDIVKGGLDSRNVLSEIYLSNLSSNSKISDCDEFTKKAYNKHNAILNFILEHASDNFSVNEEYIMFSGGEYNSSEFVFTTNKVDEFIDMILRDDNYDTH